MEPKTDPLKRDKHVEMLINFWVPAVRRLGDGRSSSEWLGFFPGVPRGVIQADPLIFPIVITVWFPKNRRCADKIRNLGGIAPFIAITSGF